MSLIESRSLNDAWRDTMWECVNNGYDYKIEKGSYEGQIRKQLPFLMLRVIEPWTRPFIFFTPPGIPQPTDEDHIHKYFYNYLITGDKQENEDYTYGQFITVQLQTLINILNESEGNTNQACMNIGGSDNINMTDPPCLRTLDFKVVNGKLNLSCYFRSWDIFTGLPENLAGFQLLKEYIGMHLTFPFEDGEIIAYSAGAHLYEMYFPVVNCLNATQIKIKEDNNE